MRRAVITLMMGTVTLVAACSEPGDSTRSTYSSESFPTELGRDQSKAESCEVSDVSQGPRWKGSTWPSFGGVALGDASAIVTGAAARTGLRAVDIADSEGFSLPGDPRKSALGYVPWLRKYQIDGDWGRRYNDLAGFMLEKRGPISDGKGVPSAVVFAAPSGNTMSVAAIHAVFPVENPDGLMRSFVDRYGKPTVGFRISGICGDTMVALYTTGKIEPSPWIFDHYRTCMAAGSPEGAVHFDCDRSHAIRSRWFGISLHEGSASIHLEDGAVAFENRYGGSAVRTVLTVED